MVDLPTDAGSPGARENPYPGGRPSTEPVALGDTNTKTEGVMMNPPPYAFPRISGVYTGTTLKPPSDAADAGRDAPASVATGFDR